MSTTLVAFDCGAGVVVEPGQSAQDVVDEHASCEDCIQAQIDHLEEQLEVLRQRAYAARQKKWEARVDRALADARRIA